MSAPAVLYVLHHPEHGAVKVGVAGGTSVRLDRFRSTGWAEVRTWRFEVGGDAYGVEQEILAHLRGRGLGAFLDPDQMPYSGWTETFDAGLVSALELVRLVEVVTR